MNEEVISTVVSGKILVEDLTGAIKETKRKLAMLQRTAHVVEYTYRIEIHKNGEFCAEVRNPDGDTEFLLRG